MVRLLRNIYNTAAFSVKSNNEVTRKLWSSEGVLQREILSPLLFVLFIVDLEDFRRENGCEGINIDGIIDLLLLLYADDLAILSSSEKDLNKKLDLLFQYCQANKLAINVSKTKIICC